jgi:hypothetical protein
VSTSPVPPVRVCGQYRPGHDVHFIQARLSFEGPPGTPTTIRAIDGDGTVHLTDGTTRWNHDPDRLRWFVEQLGGAATIRSHGVLTVRNHLFCVSGAPDPCRPTPPGPLPGESFLAELTRRGGALRRGADLLAELDRTGPTDVDDDRV